MIIFVAGFTLNFIINTSVISLFKGKLFFVSFLFLPVTEERDLYRDHASSSVYHWVALVSQLQQETVASILSYVNITKYLILPNNCQYHYRINVGEKK